MVLSKIRGYKSRKYKDLIEGPYNDTLGGNIKTKDVQHY